MKWCVMYPIMMIVIVLHACKSDQEAIQEEKFIGNWTLKQTFLNEFEKPLTSCELTNTMRIAADGDMLLVSYDLQGNACNVQKIMTAHWTYLREGNYRIDMPTKESSFIEIIETETQPVLLYRTQVEEVVTKHIYTKDESNRRFIP